ncbi:thioesterase superfamily protein [Capsaspora owczarzaki ATCC 30864]|uniref:Thioesterase superfamily protein n=1 Tax=Capsaspora owczarzaki (strain ATCC 30864) TaxID=595528 RepID=A0A0D2WSV1_CAPO3|nr:thioesterase superfamily protein [Capsaspora owczarzaki ATCC 30864]KJE95395.1 thioesterase superfamily protein [Capsaspora owczarzaki ATCC 30864]|eukprot:XP_004345439.1 thioesterase superfamily protein [Capsaspora owczarzaki ATCC 30864]
MSGLEAGRTGTATVTVTATHTAQAMGSGSVNVFATPQLVALMEAAAVNAVAGVLPDKCTSVGTLVNVSHVAATPVGMTVTATATLKQVSGKKLEFTVEARDEKEVVGSGEHHRFIVDEVKFADRANAKLPAASL